MRTRRAITFDERKKIEEYLKQGFTYEEIGRLLNRLKAVIYKEVIYRGFKPETYSADSAHLHAELKIKRGNIESALKRKQRNIEAALKRKQQLNESKDKYNYNFDYNLGQQIKTKILDYIVEQQVKMKGQITALQISLDIILEILQEKLK